MFVPKPPPVLPGGGAQPARRAPRKAEPKADQPARAGRADPLPLGAVAQMGTARFQHGGPVRCLATSADGKKIASGSEGADTTVRVWAAATGKELFRCDLKSAAFALAFARDGNTLAAGTEDRAVWLLDAATGRKLRRMTGHQQAVSAVVFCPDGKTLISAGHDGTVRWWKVATGKEVCQFVVLGTKVHCLALSRDGKTLAAGCEEVGRMGHNPIRLWDVAARKEIRPDVPRYKGMYQNDAVRGLAFTPDGKCLASGAMNGEVRLWDVRTGGSLRVYPGRPWPVQALAFSRDGKTLAAGCVDGRVYCWEAQTGKPFRLYAGHYETSAGGRVLGVSSVAFLPNGKTLASAGCDNRVRLWDVAGGQERFFAGHRYAIASVAFAPNGQSLLTGGGRDQAVRLWSVRTGKELLRLRAPSPAAGALGYPTSVAFAPDGKAVAATGADGCIQIWDTRTGAQLRRLGGRHEQFGWVAFPGAGRLAAAGYAGKPVIRLWDVTAGCPIRTFRVHDRFNRGFRLSPNHRLCAGCDQEGAVCIWDAASGEEIRRLGRQGCTGLLAFSPDSRLLAAVVKPGQGKASDCSIRSWEVATGKELCRLAASRQGQIHALAFSPDGKALASGGSDRAVHLWELSTGGQRACFVGHQNAVTCVAFSPDGKALASGSQDGTALVWDATGRTPPRRAR
jgi:WD40 repeat protein